MIISFDTKAYFLSCLYRFANKKNIRLDGKNRFLKFLGQGKGPQEFSKELISNIKQRNLAVVTNNFLISDLHIINSGSYSLIWNHLKPKNKNRLIIRLDGVGIDSQKCQFNDKVNNDLINLCNKTSYAIFQSKFCKECFENIYNYSPPSSVIYNGTSLMPPLSKKLELYVRNIKNLCKNGYLVVAGRNSPRKRILETIHKYNQYLKMGSPYLIVLSDIPKDDIPKSKKIIYLGLQSPLVARKIISDSLGLIHLDQYDWCPNIVVAASFDKVPIICSNYGGTKEIVKSNGIVINEFPNNLPSNIEGMQFARNSRIPHELFVDALDRLLFDPRSFERNNNLFMKNTAISYINVCKKVLDLNKEYCA